jgi:hypothetical protein
LITLRHTPQSVGLLWTRDKPVAETSTWQHKHCTRDKHPCPGGIRTHDPSKRSAVDLRLRPRGRWDRCRQSSFHIFVGSRRVIRPTTSVPIKNYVKTTLCNFGFKWQLLNKINSTSLCVLPPSCWKRWVHNISRCIATDREFRRKKNNPSELIVIM